MSTILQGKRVKFMRSTFISAHNNANNNNNNLHPNVKELNFKMSMLLLNLIDQQKKKKVPNIKDKEIREGHHHQQLLRFT